MIETISYVTKPCCMCHETSTLKLDPKALEAWQSGTLVQKAFPLLSAEMRELIISGIHPACWGVLFAEE